MPGIRWPSEHNCGMGHTFHLRDTRVVHIGESFTVGFIFGGSIQHSFVSFRTNKQTKTNHQISQNAKDKVL